MYAPAPRQLSHPSIPQPRLYQPYLFSSAHPSSSDLRAPHIPRVPGMAPSIPPTPQSPFPPGLPMGSASAGPSSAGYNPSFLASRGGAVAAVGASGIPHYGQPESSPALQPVQALPPPGGSTHNSPRASASASASGSGSASASRATSVLGLVREDVRLTAQSWAPKSGPPGTVLSIRVHIAYPQSPPSTSSGQPATPPRTGRKALRVVVGACAVHTTVQTAGGAELGVAGAAGLGGAGGVGGIVGDGKSQVCVLGAAVPSWVQAGGAAYDFGGAGGEGGPGSVPVCVQMLADDNAIVKTVQLGHFVYTGELSKKRSGEHLESSRHSPPEPVSHRRVASGSSSSTFSGNTDLQSYFSPGSSAYGKLPSGQYIDSAYQSPYASSTSLPSGPAVPPPSYTTSSAPQPPQPSLMRTSQQPGGGSGIPVTPIMPYISTGQKASLELNGDLNSLAVGWSSEEWAQHRRLVQFWRRQEGTTIHAQFRVVSQADWPFMQSSIVVSCLFWEARNACYISSVDVIYLLEALVGAGFTVEEKNRIRRNLEGFRPITVDKGKPETEDFFRQIMNLPNPRPRNIEKNVKVYAWESLGAALKKIIGKYSASVPTGPPAPPSSSFLAGPSYPPLPAASSSVSAASSLVDNYSLLHSSSSASFPPQLSHPLRTQSLSQGLPQSLSHASGSHAHPHGHAMSAPLVAQHSDDSSSYAYSQHGTTNPSTPTLQQGGGSPYGVPGGLIQPSGSGSSGVSGVGGVGSVGGEKSREGGDDGIGLYLGMPGSYAQGAQWVGSSTGLSPTAGRPAVPGVGSSTGGASYPTSHPLPPSMGGYPSAPTRPYPQPHQPHQAHQGQPGPQGYAQRSSSSSGDERGMYAHPSGYGGMGSGSGSGSGSSQGRGGQSQGYR
ncbi:hypothetical protein IAT38_000457 [Cryptococcus sp. DSM 104549]